MKALVTGGGGFLGFAIVRRLLARGYAVRSFSRKRYAALADLGVEQLQGDLGDAVAVAAAVAGCELVFHVAALPGIWGSKEQFQRTNVLGTQHVIAGSRAAGCARLVYTSSPSVVFDGTDMEGVNEGVAYPAHYLAEYPRTKAEAERCILAANDQQLATVALRPHLIWGPGDNHLVPRILARGRAGQLRRIGTGNPLVDTTYIDDAAEAHLLAAERLAVGSPVAGKVYFISSGTPLPIWDVVNAILQAGGIGPVNRRVPSLVAYAGGALLEAIHWSLGLSTEPRMTRFLAKELSTAHWFDISAARRDLNYAPKVSFEEGLRRLKESLAETNEPKASPPRSSTGA